MKNKFFRKKNIGTKKTIIFVLLLSVVIYACERELSELSSENEANEEMQAIEKAKAWYDANKPQEMLLRSSNGKEKMSMSPVWKNAYTMKNDKYEMIETDLMSYGRIMYLDENCVKKFEETQNIYYEQCYTHLVFRINRATKDTVGFLMTIVPNVEYLEKSDFKPFLESSYLYRPKQFGGLILYHNMDGSFSNGWIYEKGKITRSIKEMDTGSVGLELRSSWCEITDYYLNIWNCPAWYTGTEEGYGAFCTLMSTTYIGSSYNCYNDGSGDGDYTIGTGGGGGSTPPSSTPSDSPNNPCVSGITGSNNNNTMLANSKVIANMNNPLSAQAKNSTTEWAVSIGRNPDGSYYVTDPKNSGVNGHTTIPDLPPGIPLVTYGHSHNQYSIGVPSPGDLYGFLEALASNPSLNSMYVYGTGPNDTPETYAINVDDRGTVAAFLAKYPKSANMVSNADDFIQGSTISDAYKAAMQAFNAGNYNFLAGAYPYIREAFALSYIMSKFNMGVSLTRKVNNEPFKIINTQNAIGTYNISTCQ